MTVGNFFRPDEAAVRRMLLSGRTYLDIAEHYRVPRSTVEGYISSRRERWLTEAVAEREARGDCVVDVREAVDGGHARTIFISLAKNTFHVAARKEKSSSDRAKPWRFAA